MERKTNPGRVLAALGTDESAFGLRPPTVARRRAVRPKQSDCRILANECAAREGRGNCGGGRCGCKVGTACTGVCAVHESAWSVGAL